MDYGLGLEMLMRQLGQPDPNDPNAQPGAPTPVAPGNDITAAIQQLSQFKPQHQFSDMLSQQLQNYPQRTPPTKMQSILGNLAALQPHAMAESGGQPIGYVATDPKAFMQAQDQYTNRPFYTALEDWMNKLKPIEAGAADERYINANALRQLNDVATRQNAADKNTEQVKRDTNMANYQQGRLAISKYSAETRRYVAEHPKGKEVVLPDGRVAIVDLTDGSSVFAKFADDGQQPVTTTSEIQKLNKQGDTAEKVANIRAAAQQANIHATGEEQRRTNAERISQQERANEMLAAAKSKAELFKPTTQTRTMMEGAQMALPHLDEIQGQAKELANRGAFGVFMSRARAAAAKIGTAGSPEDIQKSIDEYNSNIVNYAAESNDTLVGEFASNLALMTTLMGRIHGGARGGGSPEMIKYMKDVLTSDSTYPMFEGRMKTLRNYLQKYAAGPRPPATTEDIKKKLKEILATPDTTGGK